MFTVAIATVICPRPECSRHFVAGGNHGSQIAQPARAERHATPLVLKWAGPGTGDGAVGQFQQSGSSKWVATLDRKPGYPPHAS
ncbi:MAG: hypothetical protein ACR2FG_02740 [Marmoricola sp.]